MTKRNFMRILLSIVFIPFIIISYIIPRDRKLWVFGNFKGYIDNAKYMYEYVQKNYPEINCVWIARKKEEYRILKKIGVNVKYVYSVSGYVVVFRSGVTYITNGFTDVNRIAALGSYVVHLWHGTPIKKIQLDADIESKINFPIIGKFLSFILKKMMKLLNSNINLLVANSEEEKRRFLSAFGLKNGKCQILGSPRYEIINCKENKNVCRQKLDIINTNKIKILYAPTWRECGWSLGQILQNPVEFDYFLASQNACIYIKNHPLTTHGEMLEWGVESMKNICILDNDFNDINYMYNSFDIIITDFSSVIYDCLSLKKPTLCFMSDFADYNMRGFYESLSNIFSGRICQNWDELKKEIIHVLDDNCYGVLNKKFFELNDSRCMFRIANYVQKKF